MTATPRLRLEMICNVLPFPGWAFDHHHARRAPL
jgi:hypothetical protein